jgi:predicted dehydrogenase
MKKVAMPGSGFIARFYADSLQGYRNKDKIVTVYSRKEASAKKFAEDYKVSHHTKVQIMLQRKLKVIWMVF